MRFCVGHQHWQFWPILARFMYYYSLFWGSGVISTINEPWGAFTPQFWPILARFMDYYSLLWGPGVISTINEHWGAFMCRSSTLTILADPGMFRALLLTVLGSWSDFHN